MVALAALAQGRGQLGSGCSPLPRGSPCRPCCGVSVGAADGHALTWAAAWFGRCLTTLLAQPRGAGGGTGGRVGPRGAGPSNRLSGSGGQAGAGPRNATPRAAEPAGADRSQPVISGAALAARGPICGAAPLIGAARSRAQRAIVLRRRPRRPPAGHGGAGAGVAAALAHLPAWPRVAQPEHVGLEPGEAVAPRRQWRGAELQRGSPMAAGHLGSRDCPPHPVSGCKGSVGSSAGSWAPTPYGARGSRGRCWHGLAPGSSLQGWHKPFPAACPAVAELFPGGCPAVLAG